MELPLSKFPPSITSFIAIIQVFPSITSFIAIIQVFPLNYEFYCHYPSFSPQLRVLLPLSKFFPSITSFTAIIQVFPLNYEFYCHYQSFSPQLRVLRVHVTHIAVHFELQVLNNIQNISLSDKYISKQSLVSVADPEGVLEVRSNQPSLQPTPLPPF